MFCRALNLILLSQLVMFVSACAPSHVAQTVTKFDVSTFEYSGRNWKTDLIGNPSNFEEIVPVSNGKYGWTGYVFETASESGQLIFRVRAHGDFDKKIEAYCPIEYNFEAPDNIQFNFHGECVDESGESIEEEVYLSRATVGTTDQFGDVHHRAYIVYVVYDYDIFSAPRRILMLYQVT